MRVPPLETVEWVIIAVDYMIATVLWRCVEVVVVGFDCANADKWMLLGNGSLKSQESDMWCKR